MLATPLTSFWSYSYCGAQIFEIYGLGKEIVDLSFCGSVSKIGGLTFDEVRKTYMKPLVLWLNIFSFILVLGKGINILQKIYNDGVYRSII